MNNIERYALALEITAQFRQEVKNEYYTHKMSGNLANSLKTTYNEREFSAKVLINAPKYDIWEWWYKRAIVKLNTGSYAEDNDSGSGGIKRGKGAKSGYVLVETKLPNKRLKMLPTRHHINFVNRCMTKAINSVMKENGIKDYTIVYRGR